LSIFSRMLKSRCTQVEFAFAFALVEFSEVE
jgi:hypothetical protein